MSNAKDNYTNYTYGTLGSILFPIRALCLSLVKSVTGKFHMIVPFEDIQTELKKEDVYRWNEIGNKLMYPATITEGYSNFGSANEKLCKIISENKVKLIRDDSKGHVNFNSKYTKKATLRIVYQGGNPNQFSVQATQDEGLSAIRIGSNVYIESRDYLLEETGECLSSYLTRKKKEVEDSIKAGPNNCFIITIDTDKATSPYHKLAILTFYRYLWSSYYKKIVSDTFKVIDTGIDPWDALMLVHASIRDTNYDSYYALTDRNNRVILPMHQVLENIKILGLNGGHKKAGLLAALPSFRIENTGNFAPIVALLKTSDPDNKEYKFECIDSDGVDLVEGRVYQASGLSDSKIRVLNSNYYNLWYKLERFKKI